MCEATNHHSGPSVVEGVQVQNRLNADFVGQVKETREEEEENKKMDDGRIQRRGRRIIYLFRLHTMRPRITTKKNN
jgi:hypothetical protein